MEIKVKEFFGKCFYYQYLWGKRDFHGGSHGKESACNAGVPGVVPGLGRSSGEGPGNPLQDSCLENPMNRGAWQATVHRGHTESDTTKVT